ncbi:MAG: hypothetical protein K2O59_12480 [Lachnospiraceae bacterium]|nr:hypothetical protein [Lachnospiraceae bacterium]
MSIFEHLFETKGDFLTSNECKKVARGFMGMSTNFRKMRAESEKVTAFPIL